MKRLEVILRETTHPIKISKHVMIMETKHGLICANAGVDESNINVNGYLLLPKDPDKSAFQIRNELEKHFNEKLAVIITDTFGRPWRMGQTNVAIGVSGINPILKYHGELDTFGRELNATMIAVADQIAGTSELVMGKTDRVPVAVLKGYVFEHEENSSSKQLIRPENEDLFR